MTITVGKSNARGNYYNLQYSQANPSEENKIAHTVQKNENLWSIAKKHLNKKNASQAEILDMMYAIAKLNKKDSIEKANNLKINETIYLPSKIDKTPQNKTQVRLQAQPTQKQNRTTKGQTQVSTKPVQTATNRQPERFAEDVQTTSKQINEIITHPNPRANYSQRALYKYNNIKNIDNELYLSHGKAGINYWTDLLATDNEKLILSNSYTYKPGPTGLEIIKKVNDQRYGTTEAHLLVQIDDKGKVKEVAFDSPGADVYDIHFDYKLHTDGKIERPTGYGIYKQIGTLPQVKCQRLIDNLQRYVDKNLLNRQQ